MRLSKQDLSHLAEIASLAAREAGEMVARSRPKTILYKEQGESLASQVLTEVDQRSQAIILDILRPTLDSFDLALLAEESEDDGSRFHKDYFWCIDPLDGTLPYIEGVPGYSVSVALVRHDGAPCVGVIFDPVTEALYSSIEKGVPRISKSPQTLSFFSDRSFKDDPRFPGILGRLEEVAVEMGLVGGVDVCMTGGAAMNACWVLGSAPACYFKLPKEQAGGGSVWDFAATAAIFKEAGAVATDFWGAPLDLNRAGSTFMNHRGILFASNETLAGHIMNLI